ncbi:MAG: glycine cleavage system protein GcvH [Actinomycetia bacterium]|nr:glycine cleavage system protein GcvH [Actinomycetes bacterium]MCP4962677.1 glycine cleavage system protein GcvH [Actinomycetes bacterium]
MNTPDDVRYSRDHEWIRFDAGGTHARIGITDYAQDALGDVVFVDLPETGREVEVNESFAEVESTKSVSDIYAPLSGVIVEVNSTLDDAPETLNEDPYGEGWICVLEVAADVDQSELMSAAEYAEFTEG